MTSESGRRPAFPNQAPLTDGLDRTGLTVRQYYKAAAMQGTLAGDTNAELSTERLSSVVARLADAMIAEDEAYVASIDKAALEEFNRGR